MNAPSIFMNLLLYSFFSGSDDATSEVSSTTNLVLSKIDGNIRVLDSKNNPIDNVEVPLEVKDGYSVLTSTNSSAVISLNSDLTFRFSTLFEVCVKRFFKCIRF